MWSCAVAMLSCADMLSGAITTSICAVAILAITPAMLIGAVDMLSAEACCFGRSNLK